MSASVAAMMLASPVMAQAVWDGSASTDYGTGANWSTNAVPNAATNVTINNSLAPPNAPTVGAGGGAANTLSLTNLTLTVNGVLTVAGALSVFDNGIISGGGGTVNAASVSLGDDALPNGFLSGALTLNANTLTLRQTTIAAGVTSNIATSITKTSSGAAAVAGALNGAASVAISAGTLNLFAANGYLGGTNISGGTVTLSTAAATLGAGGVTFSGAGVLRGAVDTAIANGLTINAGVAATFGAAAGTTLALNPANFTVGAGSTFRVGGGDNGTVALSLGAGPVIGASALDVQAGATLRAGNATAAGAFASFSNGATVNGTLDVNGFASGAQSLSGTGTITNGGAAAATFTATNAADSVFGGVLQNGASALALTKDGAGQLTLTGVNTYTGATTVTAGALTLGAGGSLIGAGGAHTAVTVNNDGVLNVNAGGLAQVNSLTVNAGGTVLNNGDIQGFGATINIAGMMTSNVKLNDATDINVLAGGTLNAQGEVSAPLVTNAGTFNVTGNLTGVGTGPHVGPITNFTNQGAAGVLNVNAGTFSGITNFNNNSTAAIGVNIAAGATLSANAIGNGVGATLVNSGTLTSATTINNAGTLTSTGTLNGALNSGGTVNASGAINGAITNTGAFNVTGALVGDGSAFNNNAGTLAVSANSFTGIGALTNVAGVTVAAGGVLGTDTIVQNAGSIISAGAINATTSITINGGILTAVGAITTPQLTNIASVNAGGTITGAVANNAGGVFTVIGLLTISGQFSQQAGATLDLNGDSLSVGSLSGAGSVTNGGAFASRLTAGGDGVSTTFSGAITNGVSAVALTKTGPGGLVLSGAGLNTYTGATAVNSGTLAGGALNAFSAASAHTVAGGAFLNLGGFNQTIGSLAGAGTVTNSGPAAATLTAGGDGTSTTFSGAIVNGAAATGLTKVGGGVMTLTGTSTHTGDTNINAGTLRIGATGALTGVGGVHSDITVGAAGTLDVLAGGLVQGNVITNNGSVTSAGRIEGFAATINNAGVFASVGVINDATDINNLATGTFNVSGELAAPIVRNDGIFNVTGNLTGVGTGPHIGPTTTFNNQGVGVLNVNVGTYSGITNFNNTSAAAVGVNIAAGAALTADTVTNALGSTIANAGTLSSTTAPVANNGTLNNAATGVVNGGVANTAALNNTGGTINGGVTNTGAGVVATSGVINGGVTNSATVNATAGQVNGAIINNAGANFNVTGAVATTGTFTNTAATANLTVNGGGAYTVSGALTNSGVVTVGGATAGTLSAGTVVNNNGATITVNANGAMNGDLANSGTVTNNGVYTGNLANAATGIVNNNLGATWNGNVANSGTIANAGTWNGDLSNAAGGIINNTGSWNGAVTGTTDIVNSGAFNGSGVVSGTIANNAGGVFTVTGNLLTNNTFTNANGATLAVTGGDLTGVTTLGNSGAINIAATRTLAANNVSNNATGVITNNGTLTSANVIANAGLITNNATGTINGGVNNTGTLTTTGAVNGGVTNSNVVNAAGTISGAIANNAGTFTVTGALVGDNTVTNANGATLAVTGGNFTGITTLTNSGAINVAATRTLSANNVSNNAAGAITNDGTLTSAAVIANAGLITNNATGVINGGVNNTGTLNTTGAVNGGITNSNIVNAAGTIGGAIANNGGGVFTVTGPLIANNTFSNANGATLAVTGGNFTGITALTNSGAINVAAARLLSAGSITNNAAGTIANDGTVTSAAPIANAGLFTNNATGVINGGLANTGTFNQALGGALNGGLTNTNIVNAAGTINGAIANNGGAFTVTNNLVANNTFGNAAGATVNLTGGNLTGITAFTNGGTFFSSGARTLGATSFVNQATGLVTMVNNNVTDTLTMTGSYNGVAGSRIALDIDLSQDNATQRADRLTVVGAGSGASDIRSNFNIVNAGRVVFTTPIEVFRVAPGSVINVNPGLVTSSGFADYFLGESAAGSGIYQVTSQFNAAPVVGVASSIAGVISSLQTSFHQPASAIVSRPDNPAPNQWGGGPFIRFSHGESRVKLDGVATLGGVGVGSAATNTFSRFTGLQAGADLGLYNINGTGWNFNFGLMGGIVNATASALSTTPTPAGNTLVSTTAKLDVPFIGLYAFLSNGPFTAEFNVRKDFYDTTFASTGVGGVPVFVAPGTTLKGDGINFNFNASYRFTLVDAWYIEPTIGISHGRYNFDRLALATGAPGQDFMTFSETRSTLGRIGFNVGTAFQATEKLIIAPFLSASVWREFSDNSQAQAVLGTLGGQVFNVSTGRVGTFGQVGGGVQFKVNDTPFLGFVRGDIRFGSKVEGKALNIGLKAQF